MIKGAKLFLALLCFLASSASYAGCALPQGYVPIAQRAAKSMLYEVESCSGVKSYVFGTYHSDDPALYPLAAFVVPYLQNSETLYVEIAESSEDAAASMKHLSLPAAHAGLQTLLSPELYAQTKAHIAPLLNMPESSMNRFQPWALALMVQYPAPVADGIVLDARLQHDASQYGVTSLGLESMDSQFAIFHAMPLTLQIDFLESTLEDIEELIPTLEKLQALYVAQDLPELYRESMALFDKTALHYPDLAQYLRQHLIETRNLKMAQTISQHIDKNKLFIAVGALHLPDQTGLLAQLERDGAQIRPISMPSF